MWVSAPPSPGVQLCSWTGEQPGLVAAQGIGAVMLDLQDKPGTNSNLILLSTAGLGAVSLDLCRKNSWGKQIRFFRKSSVSYMVGCEAALFFCFEGFSRLLSSFRCSARVELDTVMPDFRDWRVAFSWSLM